MSYLFYTLFGGSIPAICVLLYLFKHPDKFEHWMAIFNKIGLSLSSYIPRLKKKFDRRAVASSIQDCVNGTCELIEKQSPGILPHAVRIEWVDCDTPESFIKKGRVVVRLRHYKNQDKNIVDSTLLYLNVGLLPRARYYLDESLRRCTEYRIASQIFLSKRSTGAYAYFIGNVLNPALRLEPALKNDLQTIEDLDSAGYFTRVFLEEAKQVGDKMLGSHPTEAVYKELRDYAIFLATIATKGWDENVPLEFDGAKIRACVILVARKEIIRSYGIEPYINRIKRNVNRGFDSIYIAGKGEEFIGKILQIKKVIDGKDVTILRRCEYIVKVNVSAILLVCQSNISYLARQREIKQDVGEAMTEIIPEIKNREIEIVAVARIKGIGCKISVRPAVGQEMANAAGACIGEKADRASKIKEKLGGEFVTIVSWSNIPINYISNALWPLKESAIESIEIDESQLVANVKLNSEDALRRARGKDGINLILASQLTGWHIILEKQRSGTENITAEDELYQLCSRMITEIRNFDIEIVRLARIRGIGSRVIVKWAQEQDNTRRILASQACGGPSGEVLRQLETQMGGERLYFHEWYSDSRDLIISCLYPIKKRDIYSVELNQIIKTAIIRIKPHVNHESSRINNDLIMLAERVTGWRIQISILSDAIT